MNELSLDAFRRAIRATHGSESQLVDRVSVEESCESGRIWQGEVLVFALLGNHISTRCYAWEVDGRITAVLHAGPVDSAVKAVKASMPAPA